MNLPKLQDLNFAKRIKMSSLLIGTKSCEKFTAVRVCALEYEHCNELPIDEVFVRVCDISKKHARNLSTRVMKFTSPI